MPLDRSVGFAAVALGLAACSGTHGKEDAQAPIENVALSRGGAEFSASVPEMAIDPRDPRRVAVIWRDLAMTDPGGEAGRRGMHCHLSLSTDGGKTFATRALSWDMPDTPVCNSPFVDIGPRGDLLIGATLAGVLPQNAPAGRHAFGQVAMRLSHDWGASWSATRSPIASDQGERFAPNPAVPVEATRIPWDGGRGVIDRQTGAIVISGGFPAPPGEDLHSQRFFTVSTDGRADWGPIRAFAAPGWPQRWDGAMVSAHGVLAISYLADAVPDPTTRCLCVVFATSTDGGKSFVRHVVGRADGFDKLVHYPPIAADPRRKGGYALAEIVPDRGSPVVRLTDDGGASWRTAGGLQTPESVVRASRPALAYSPDGKLALIWRGYRPDGSYDIYMAAAEDGDFGPAVRVSTQSSHEPEDLRDDYSVRGDFVSAIAAGPALVHGAWTDWRGETGQIAYAQVPFVRLLPAKR